MVNLKKRTEETGISDRAYRRKYKIPLDIQSHLIELNIEDGTWTKIEE